MASLCHPWFTTTNLSYRFPIFETSATALCGTTGIQWLPICMDLQTTKISWQFWSLTRFSAQKAANRRERQNTRKRPQNPKNPISNHGDQNYQNAPKTKKTRIIVVWRSRQSYMRELCLSGMQYSSARRHCKCEANPVSKKVRPQLNVPTGFSTNTTREARTHAAVSPPAFEISWTTLNNVVTVTLCVLTALEKAGLRVRGCELVFT